MDKIQQAAQKVVERNQLIENIIRSEVQYLARKQRLLQIGDNITEERMDLEKYIAHDEEIIALWKANYDISDADILEKRNEVLDKVAIEKQEALDRQEVEMKEEIERITAQIQQIPDKKVEVMENIDSIKLQVSPFTK